MSELTNIARPYAKAAFDFALEHNALSGWQQMLAFAAEVAKDEQMNVFLRSNSTADTQANLFNQVCGEQFDQPVQNLIKLMAENQRLLALPEVFVQFSELKDDHEREISVDVIAATELNAAQQEKLAAALSKRLARKVKLNCSVDPNVVGGMLMKAGDMVIDGSIRGKLDRLITTLQS
ncbi:F0F1 ATP synthase subunit delta [Alkalimonas collagenimarina]|uniref:ATP synthase subunit delta n=1 Tax=Alkalimonas collagenimarina TaxID=400390 RepID=A0ABT9H1G1_9GAMM|nr:F0F1 ATP synthase subunit delta [Alkalimonas collagenimarina]MDP4537137.1 F0F1 ATP synthase subunit delta [Alkalimonas collagenimarina]